MKSILIIVFLSTLVSSQEIDTLQYFEESDLVEFQIGHPTGFPSACVYFEMPDSIEYDIKGVRFTLMSENYNGQWEFPDINTIFIFKSDSDFVTDTAMSIPANSNLALPPIEGDWLAPPISFVNNETHLYPGWCTVDLDTISSLQNLTGDFWVFGDVLLNTMVDISPLHEYNTFYMPEYAWESNIQDRAVQVIIEYEELSTETIQRIPSFFQLFPAYPNPFNPVTTLMYDLSEKSFVSLKVYDINGRLIKTLMNSISSEGVKSVQWHGKNEKGELMATGMYFSRLEAKSQKTGEIFTSSNKMILLK